MTTERLDQRLVDEIRLRVITTRLVAAVTHGIKKPDVAHLRFHIPKFSRDGAGNVTAIKGYSLHLWNPPADSDRHPWERGLRLEVDVGEIPATVARAVKHLRKQKRSEGEAVAAWNQDEIKRLVAAGERLKSRLHIPQEQPLIVPKERTLWRPR